MTKMAENSYKKSHSVVISSILVLTILIAMSTQASASAVNLYKTTVPDHSARYQIGDTINYEMVITNPAGAPQNPNNYFMVVDISDIYPNGTVELIEASLHLNAGESKMFNRSYVVDKDDINSNGRVMNRLSVEGIDEGGDQIVISVSKQSKVVGSIGDYVWNDINADAVQDGGEPGIPNIKIDLYDSLNALVTTTTTNASGGYDFVNLLMGTYRVDVDETTLPANYVLTTANEPLDVVLGAGDDYNDADFGYRELMPSIDIEKSTNGVDADTPTGPLVPVGDTVNWEYVVTNTGNTQLTGVAVTDDQGVSVSCPKTTLAAGESMTCTASDTALVGQYENEGMVIGTPPIGSDVSDTDPSHYFGSDPSITIEKSTNGVDADTPTGPLVPVGDAVNWEYVVNNSGNVELTNIVATDDRGVLVSCPKTTLSVGESMTCTASGVATEGQYANNGTATGTPPVGSDVSDTDPSHYLGYCTGIIGDYVWLDKNADGIQDADELGIAGVTVNLYLNSILIATDVTNSTGNYMFTDLCEGEYTVEIDDSTLPSEVELTTPPEPRIVNMGIGDEILDIDFGYKCTGAIGDYVWLDVDGDGIQDAGEVGIAGVEVNLYLDDGDSVIDAGDTLLGTQVTNATGYYLFDDLCSGLYIVEVIDSTLPADVVLTTPTEPRAVDLDTSVEKNRLDVDFGYRPPCPCKAAIGDHIWMDMDNDGIYDADESGIGGVMVKLYQDNNGNGVVDAGDNLLVIKVTGANGNYLFTELCEGKYIIAVDESSLSPGVVLTTPPEPKAVDLQSDQYMLGVDFGYARPIVTSPEN